MKQDTSIHWHGIILPANMDGVPGLSFHGIAPDGMYEYKFKVHQNGTTAIRASRSRSVFTVRW